MTLPDCPHCREAGTLEPLRSEGRGIIVYECSCCSKRCRVNAGGEIVHVPDRSDDGED